MKRLLLVGVFLFPFFVLAHQPVLPEFVNYDDYKTITEPAVSQAFYSELIGYPHTYEVTLESDQELFVQMLVPDIPGISTNINGLIVKKLPTGRVETITHLWSKDAQWESSYEPFGGDSYLNGPEFRQTLEAGSYLIEVSNAENLGKYVLVVGELEQFAGLGYFELIGRIYEVKQFMGKSPFSMLMSPLFTVPLVLLLLLLFVLYRVYKKRYA